MNCYFGWSANRRRSEGVCSSRMAIHGLTHATAPSRRSPDHDQTAKEGIRRDRPPSVLGLNSCVNGLERPTASHRRTNRGRAEGNRIVDPWIMRRGVRLRRLQPLRVRSLRAGADERGQADHTDVAGRQRFPDDVVERDPRGSARELLLRLVGESPAERGGLLVSNSDSRTEPMRPRAPAAATCNSLTPSDWSDPVRLESSVVGESGASTINGLNLAHSRPPSQARPPVGEPKPVAVK